MFKNLSHKKAFIALICVFVGLFILNYIFVIRHERNAKMHPDLPESFPADTAGPWQSYVWKGNIYGYPNDWVLTEEKGAGNDEVVSFRLAPKAPLHAEDYISVGGNCETLRVKLCIGVPPVSTNSTDSSVLLIYNTVIKHITKVPTSR